MTLATAPDPATGIQVRAAGGDRAGAFAALHRLSFDRPWTEGELRRLIEGPCAFALEAVPQMGGQNGSDPLGFIVVRAVAGEAEILTLAVDPGARRRGLGLSLVHAAASASNTFGAEVMWLEVAVDNAAALALYAAAGFQAAGQRRRYYVRPEGERVDALVMRRLLNSVAA